jgi:hypothetical protein
MTHDTHTTRRSWWYLLLDLEGALDDDLNAAGHVGHLLEGDARAHAGADVHGRDEADLVQAVVDSHLHSCRRHHHPSFSVHHRQSPPLMVKKEKKTDGVPSRRGMASALRNGASESVRKPWATGPPACVVGRVVVSVSGKGWSVCHRVRVWRGTEGGLLLGALGLGVNPLPIAGGIGERVHALQKAHKRINY